MKWVKKYLHKVTTKSGSFVVANSIFRTHVIDQVGLIFLFDCVKSDQFINLDFFTNSTDIWQSPTDCAFTFATSQPSQSTWVDNGARLVRKKKPVQKPPNFEIFGSTSKPSATSSVNRLESFGNDKQPPPNINIEIHNVFSFSDKPKNGSLQSPISHEFDNQFQIPHPSNQSSVFFGDDDLN